MSNISNQPLYLLAPRVVEVVKRIATSCGIADDWPMIAEIFATGVTDRVIGPIRTVVGLFNQKQDSYQFVKDWILDRQSGLRDQDGIGLLVKMAARMFFWSEMTFEHFFTGDESVQRENRESVRQAMFEIGRYLRHPPNVRQLHLALAVLDVVHEFATPDEAIALHESMKRACEDSADSSGLHFLSHYREANKFAHAFKTIGTRCVDLGELDSVVKDLNDDAIGSTVSFDEFDAGRIKIKPSENTALEFGVKELIEEPLNQAFDLLAFPKEKRDSVFANILNVLMQRAEDRGSWVEKVATKPASSPLVTTTLVDLPTTAPALWSRDKQPGDTPPTFIKRHYGQYLRSDNKGLTRSDIRQLDKSLYMGLSNWLRKNELPTDCPLPYLSERVTAELEDVSLPHIQRLAAAQARRSQKQRS